jgi:hypothetical protein
LTADSHDNNIYIYAIDGNTYDLKGTSLKEHNSYMTGFDWSKDGKVAQNIFGTY